MFYLKQCLFNKRSVLAAIVIVVFVTITITLQPTSKETIAVIENKKFDSEIGCYETTDLESLPDISDNPRPPENSIFFHETSCKSYKNNRITIEPRQACAVESAAFTHPNRSIYLLFTSPGLILSGFKEKSDLILSALQSYGNVKIVHANYKKYISNTPVEHLYTSGKIKKSSYPLAHASDIMRYLTLYKYGGVYLDLDVLMMRSLDDLGPNFSGMETSDGVAAGVIGLSSRNWTTECLEDLSKNFDGKKWCDSSVGVMTRLVHQLCNSVKMNVISKMNCSGFQVLPSPAFYPIPYWEWMKYFEPLHNKYTLNKIKDSYSIHMWNKLSHKTDAVNGSVYTIMAEKFCPKVFKAIGGNTI